MTTHTPVLLQEVLGALAIQPDDVVVDCTLGGGGYATSAVSNLSSSGVFVGIDTDERAIDRCKDIANTTKAKVYLVNTNFRYVGIVLDELEIKYIDKCMLDLGLSSFQIEEGERGFSFQKDEPLIMTFSSRKDGEQITAENIVNSWDEKELSHILFSYAEERYARKIARAIVLAREKKPFTTTFELRDCVISALPFGGKKSRIHPATKTFQAIRIAVNEEYLALEEVLDTALHRLSPKGKIAVVSFHSGEDRIVKTKFKEAQVKGWGAPLTKKPIVPSEEELTANPRARSAKLRVFEKI